MLSIKKLLTKILERLTVSSVLVPLNTTLFQHYSTNDHLIASKCGSIVTLQGIVAPKSELATAGGGNAVIGTVPEDYRPTSRYARGIMQGSGTNRWFIVIQTDGQILIDRYANSTSYETVPASAWLVIHITYMQGITSLS